jgi:uncharacterized protein
VKTILPAAALDQHTAVLGKTGSGKTYATKAVIVEPLLERGAHVGIVDPTDAWWGLRSSRDGKGPGFSVLILGGDHGDLPLPANGGAAVARLLIEQRINLVACTKHLTVGERTRWAVDFFGTINRLNRRVLHLVVDEAHNFAPKGKIPDPDVGKMLHAVNALASEGRSKGIRFTMLTQRPQKLHNDTLTCAETLIAMRVLAPHDREAVEDWIKGCGDMAAGKEVLNSLASLQKGEGWVWYPEGGHLVRAKFPAIRTFDSSATPKEGDTIAAPKGSADVDLTEIRKALAEAVQEAEANDPKLLRAEIARLRADLAKKPSAGPDRQALADATAEGYQSGRAATAREAKEAASKIGTIAATISRATTELATLQMQLYVPSDSTPPRQPAPAARSAAAPAAPRSAPAQRARIDGISGPQQRILDGLAWLKALGIDRADRVRAAMLADQSPRSSGYEKNVSTLKTAGLITYPSQGELALTEAGEAVAEPPEVPATNAALHEAIRRHVSTPQWRIVETLIAAYPEALSRETLAERAQASAFSSGFEKNVSTLRSLGFIDYPASGQVVAQPVLFLER